MAVILLSGVHYFTGQYFDIKEITKAAHSKVTSNSLLSLSILLKINRMNDVNINKIKGLLNGLGFGARHRQRSASAARLAS